MQLQVWIGLVLLSWSLDQPLSAHQLDEDLHDETSWLQHGLSLHAPRHVSEYALQQGASALANQHAGSRYHSASIFGTEEPVGSVGLNASRSADHRKQTLPPKSQDVLAAPPKIMEKKHILAKFVVMPLALSLMIVFTISSLIEKFEIFGLPEPAVMIVIGMCLGVWAKNAAHFSFFDSTTEMGRMVYDTLNMLLLPIIIFSSGWSMRRHDFFSQFPYILLFAIMGVVLSASAVGGCIHISGILGLHSVTQLRTALAFATLISATDPVSVLATYQRLKVDPLLNIIVYGEATINDAVVIVLFDILNEDKFMNRFAAASSVQEVGQQTENIFLGIVMMFFGSFGIGFLSSCVYALLAHLADMKSNKKGQILMIFASCYLTYAVAESLGKSGIIANLFCGIFSGIYLRPHLSEEGTHMATYFLQQVAMLADAAVFVLVGLCVVQMETKHLYFALLVMIFCVMGRFFAVIPLGLFTNFMKRLSGQAAGVKQGGWNLLSGSHVFMIWHAGLRGGIALALSMELGEWVDILEGEGTRRMLQTATFVLVWFFLILFGGTTAFCLRWLKIPLGQDLPPEHLSSTEGSGPLRNFLTYVDETVLAPLLIGRNQHALLPFEADVEKVLTSSLKDFSGSSGSESGQPSEADDEDVLTSARKKSHSAPAILSDVSTSNGDSADDNSESDRKPSHASTPQDSADDNSMGDREVSHASTLAPEGLSSSRSSSSSESTLTGSRDSLHNEYNGLQEVLG